MKTLYIMSGISGSGKSTFAKKMFPFATYLNADTIRRELCGDESDQSKNKEVFELLYKRLGFFIYTDRTGSDQIVVDNTSLTVADRKKIIDHALNFISPDDLNIVIVFIRPDIGLALFRNSNRDRKVPEDVIRKQNQKIEWPTGDEKYHHSVVEIMI